MWHDNKIILILSLSYLILAVAHPLEWIHPDGIHRLIHIASYGIEMLPQNFTQL